MIVISLLDVTKDSVEGFIGVWLVLVEPSVLLFRLSELGRLQCDFPNRFPVILLDKH